MKKKIKSLLGLVILVIVLLLPFVAKNIQEKEIRNIAYDIIKFIESDDSFKNVNQLRTIYVYKDGLKHKIGGNVDLDYDVKKIKDGRIVIENNGSIDIIISDGKYCASKGYNDTAVKVTSVKEKKCIELQNINESYVISYATDGLNNFNSVIVTDDGGYLAVGNSSDVNNNSDDIPVINELGIIIKYDSKGNILWKKTFGESVGHNSFEKVIEVEDGYVVVGGIVANESGATEDDYVEQDSVIIKFDKLGNIIWEKYFGGKSFDIFTSVDKTNDGYIAVGYTLSDDGDLNGLDKGEHDAIIVKFDEKGKVLWKKVFGGTERDLFEDVVATNDGYVAVGDTYSVDGDLRGICNSGWCGIIVKFDLNGNVVWKNTFDNLKSSMLYGVADARDGYLAAGNGHLSESKSTNSNAILIKYDLNGNMVKIKK